MWNAVTDRPRAWPCAAPWGHAPVAKPYAEIGTITFHSIIFSMNLFSD
jgi:hypothetical protein